MSVRGPDPVTKTILVVANETLGGRELLDAVRERAADDVRFVLCVPQNRPKAGLVIYDDAVFEAAQVRVDLALEVIRAEGIRAIGEVADPDPYTAALDGLREYRPEEIIISTYPETRSGWLRRDLIDRVKNEAVWSGTAVGELTKKVLDNPGPHIDQAVADIFARFPIKPH